MKQPLIKDISIETTFENRIDLFYVSIYLHFGLDFCIYMYILFYM